jgi:hypothetical protein
MYTKMTDESEPLPTSHPADRRTAPRTRWNDRAPDEGAHTMGDESPRQSMTKKASAKSIKEKRSDKKAAKADGRRRWTT